MNNSTRLTTLAAAVLSIGLILIGIFGGLLPQLQSASATHSLNETSVIRNDGQRAQIQRLQQAKDDLPALEQESDELSRAIPSEPAGNQQLRTLQRLADSAGVVLEGYTASPAVAYGAETAEVAEPSTEQVAEGELPESEVPQAADPAQTVSSLVAIPVNIRVNGAYDSVVAFFRGLQEGERLIEVHSVNITETSSGDDASFAGDLSGFLFVLPRAE